MRRIQLLPVAAVVMAFALVADAQTPQETLASLRSAGGSVCISGVATALSVGGQSWRTGNDGIKLLSHPLPKPISILNVKPIDGKPLTRSGLTHLASATPSRVIRFHKGSVEDDGVQHLVEALNASGNRHLRLEMRYVAITDASIDHLKRLKKIKVLKLAHTRVTVKGTRRLARALPDCDVQYETKTPTPTTGP